MNIASLLQPISADAPCGEDLSFSPDFDSILEMRREDDPTLDQGEWKHALKTANWPGVESKCGELLQTRTKDLRLVAWLVDAATRTHGIGALADGLDLCAQSCEAYWDAIHPLPDNGDQEQRIGSLNWLLGQIPDLARRVPLLDKGKRRFALFDIETARALQQAMARGTADAQATASDEPAVTMDDIGRALSSTPRDVLADRAQSALRAVTALARLQQVVDARLGADGPGFIPARKALGDLSHEISRLLREAGGAASTDAPDGEAPDAGASATSAGGTSGASTGAPMSRAQALQQLRTVAAFFRRTEPHSPVAYLADKAAQWGELPLHAWLRVVLKDPNALAHVEELLGVEATKQTEA